MDNNKRIRYKHRMANPKVGWTREFQEAWEKIFEKPKPSITTKTTHGSQYIDVGNDSH